MRFGSDHIPGAVDQTCSVKFRRVPLVAASDMQNLSISNIFINPFKELRYRTLRDILVWSLFYLNGFM